MGAADDVRFRPEAVTDAPLCRAIAGGGDLTTSAGLRAALDWLRLCELIGPPRSSCGRARCQLRRRVQPTAVTTARVDEATP